MTIPIIWRPISGELVIDTANAGSHGSVIQAGVLNPFKAVVPLRGLNMGCRVSVNSGEPDLFATPDTFVETTEQIIAQRRFTWRPEDHVRIEAWLVSPRVPLTTVAAEFTAPRPPQPFASWTWDADQRAWQSPTPYPEDGQDYAWDEPSTSWVLAQ